MKEDNNKHFAPQTFTRKALIAASISIAILLIILLIGYAFNIVVLIFAGALIAIFYRGMGNWLEKKTSLPSGWATLVAVLAVLGVFTVGILILAPHVGKQINKLSQNIPQAVEQVQTALSQSSAGQRVLDAIPQDLLKNPEKIASKVAGFFKTTFGVLGDIYIILFIGVFFTAEPKPYKEGIIKLVPLNKRKRAREVMQALGKDLEGWLMGKIFSMLVVGILTTVGLWLLGMPLAITLGLIAGLLSFIPNFGPIIAMIPGVLVAFLESPSLALYVALLYTGVQVLETNFITPFIQREMISLPLALIIISQVLLGYLAGALALILAAPLIVVVLVLVKMLYVEDVLGDERVKV